MICIRVVGGLGNQMFGYAAAVALKERTGADRLVVDRSLCAPERGATEEGLAERPFELDGFALSAEIADGAPFGKTIRIRKDSRRRGAHLAGLRLARAAGMRPVPFYCERRDLGFDPLFSRLPDDSMIQGCFPSHRYFGEYEEAVRAEFVAREPLPDSLGRLLEAMRGCESVAVHVRCGDYLTSAKTRKLLGICSDRYYLRAAERMRAELPDVRFFVFSDDVERVRREPWTDALGADAVFVEGVAGCGPVADLTLMSRCRHQVVANSTFSWWAAWLNENEKKRIVAPSPAYDGTGLKDDDFYPSEWIRLAKRSGEEVGR